ncbi:hypothetical protein ACOMHN_002401 [Nucella lapillus]
MSSLQQAMQKCVEMNHFAMSRMCKGKASLNSVQREEHDDDEEDLDEAYVMAMDRKKNTGAWTIDIDLHNKQATFKIDTGADVSVIPVSLFNTMQPKPKLIPTRTVLRSPGGVLDCRGTIRVDAKVRGKKYNLKLYVVNTETDCLLGREEAARLELVKRIDVIGKQEELFSGLNSDPV